MPSSSEVTPLYDGIYRVDGKLATKNLIRGHPVYGERIIRIGNDEYREWNPFRSKLAAAIKKGLKTIPLTSTSSVLYLGASTGTTASHISDIVSRGVVFCVEFSPRSMRELLRVCEQRPNMIPIFEDARKPERYGMIGSVDVIYEDVSQVDQDAILLRNAQLFLKKGGYALFAIKSQCIDVTLPPAQVYDSILSRLSPSFDIIERVELSPYEKDHLFVVLRYLG